MSNALIIMLSGTINPMSNPQYPYTGQPMPVNPLDNQFTALAEPLNENGQSRIQTEQPTIQYEGYIATYINNLNICLQGIISPSTLGIDTKKLDNAEAQREKEKTTLYTRQKIISVLQETIPELVNITLKSAALLRQDEIEDVNCSVDFGEYASPSFEAQVEVVGKAAGTNIMSVQTQVETLWGDTKEDNWIKEEVARIKAENGIAEVEEPMVAPNGFIEEDMIGGMGGLDNISANRDGAEDVRIDGEKPQAPSSRRTERGGKVDKVAGPPSKKPKEVQEKP